jgi:hypothetical protein
MSLQVMIVFVSMQKIVFSDTSSSNICGEFSACLLLVSDGSVNLSEKESELGIAMKKNSLIENCWFIVLEIRKR